MKIEPYFSFTLLHIHNLKYWYGVIPEISPLPSYRYQMQNFIWYFWNCIGKISEVKYIWRTIGSFIFCTLRQTPVSYKLVISIRGYLIFRMLRFDHFVLKIEFVLQSNTGIFWFYPRDIHGKNVPMDDFFGFVGNG